MVHVFGLCLMLELLSWCIGGCSAGWAKAWHGMCGYGMQAQSK